MNKKIIIIFAVVIVVAVIAGVLFLAASNMNKAEEETAVVPYYYPLEDAFVTNVKDSGKLFKASVILVANSPDIEEILTNNQYLIRDEILFIFRGLNEEDIKRQNIQDELRTAIPEKVNQILGIDNIYSIVFGDFVMQ